ncbi:MAG: DUF6569 family protein [Bacillota bacterium]
MMEFNIGSLLDDLSWGEPEEKENMTLFPLFLKGDHPVSYLLLEEALAARVLEIGEVGDGGEVNTILAVNKGERPVLILDGEELVGAKQNRMVNATVLIPPRAAVKVPVSCVEMGRWQYGATRFERVGNFGYVTLRGRKAAQVADSLAAGYSFRADQGAIWAEIDRKQDGLLVASPTDALHDIYIGYRRELERCVEGLTPHPDQAGVAVFINDRFACLDLFGAPATLCAVWGKLIRSYAMEALEVKGRSRPGKQPDLARVLQAVREAECRTYPSVGQGTDLRLRGKDIVGAGLVDEGRVLHLSVFAGREADTGRRRTRMAGPRQRRRVVE